MIAQMDVDRIDSYSKSNPYITLYHTLSRLPHSTPSTSLYPTHTILPYLSHQFHSTSSNISIL